MSRVLQRTVSTAWCMGQSSLGLLIPLQDSTAQVHYSCWKIGPYWRCKLDQQSLALASESQCWQPGKEGLDICAGRLKKLVAEGVERWLLTFLCGLKQRGPVSGFSPSSQALKKPWFLLRNTKMVPDLLLCSSVRCGTRPIHRGDGNRHIFIPIDTTYLLTLLSASFASAIKWS